MSSNNALQSDNKSLSVVVVGCQGQVGNIYLVMQHTEGFFFFCPQQRSRLKVCFGRLSLIALQFGGKAAMPAPVS